MRPVSGVEGVARLVGWLGFIVLVLLANAGFGGLIGIGAPFVLPLLWFAARKADPWMNAICIALGGLTAFFTGMWLAWWLRLEESPLVTPILAGIVGVVLLVRDTTKPSHRSAIER